MIKVPAIVRITLAKAYAPVYPNAGASLLATSLTTLMAAPEVREPVTPPSASAEFAEILAFQGDPAARVIAVHL